MGPHGLGACGARKIGRGCWPLSQMPRSCGCHSIYWERRSSFRNLPWAVQLWLEPVTLLVFSLLQPLMDGQAHSDLLLLEACRVRH